MLNKDAWLTSIMGKNVFNLNIGSIPDLKISDLPRSASLVVAKIPVGDLRKYRVLQELKFLLIDTSIQLKKVIEERDTFASLKDITFASYSHEQQIAKIAGSSFKYDRFHSDPNIPNRIAKKIKSEWTRSFFRGSRGNWMVIAEVKGAVVGFLQILKVGNSEIAIDLIAVKNSHRQNGLAEKMINFSIENCGMKGGNIFVGTQISNIPSLSLYEKMGFRINSAQHVFHLHL
jgi:GNAT superfamily N-acetyltransferase